MTKQRESDFSGEGRELTTVPTRRQFSICAAGTTIALATRARAAGSLEPPLRVGVIGHTGRGNYGHGLDVVWKRVPQTTIVAVADGDPKGRDAAIKRLGVSKGYADYRQMLAKEHPEIVAVCPRHPDQHRDMILSAVENGALGILVEKPYCRTPAEADDIGRKCREHHVRLAIAHRNRYHPVLPVVARMVADGALGNLLEIRGRGKGDHRGGAEDLWVLGSHVLNLFHFFGGRPVACSAVLQQDGRRVVREDVYDGNEALGPLAGNQVHARYRFANGLTAYFDSMANDGTQNRGFGLQLIGSRGVVAMHCDREPLAHWISGNPFQVPTRPRPWIPISSAGVGKPETNSKRITEVQHQVAVASDLVAAIRERRAPLCDDRQAAMTVEMICACFASHRQNSSEVTIPLQKRSNALATW